MEFIKDVIKVKIHVLGPFNLIGFFYQRQWNRTVEF